MEKPPNTLHQHFSKKENYFRHLLHLSRKRSNKASSRQLKSKFTTWDKRPKAEGKIWTRIRLLTGSGPAFQLKPDPARKLDPDPDPALKLDPNPVFQLGLDPAVKLDLACKLDSDNLLSCIWTKLVSWIQTWTQFLSGTQTWTRLLS